MCWHQLEEARVRWMLTHGLPWRCEGLAGSQGGAGRTWRKMLLLLVIYTCARLGRGEAPRLQKVKTLPLCLL